MADITQPLIAFIADTYGETVTEDTPLFSTGLLDSMAVVMIAGFIQAEYDIELPPRQVVPINLNTVAAIARRVARAR